MSPFGRSRAEARERSAAERERAAAERAARRAGDPPATAVHEPVAPARAPASRPAAERQVLRERVARAEDGRVPRPRGARRLRRRIALTVLLALLGGLVWFGVSLFEPFKNGSGTGQVAVQVPPGASVGGIGAELARKGVVGSGVFFRLRARLAGKSAELKPGRYLLARNMSYGAALDRLTSGPPAPTIVRVVIPEGRSRRETAVLVRRAGLTGSYLSASTRSSRLNPRRYGAPRGTSSLEGFLFPATYELRGGAPATRLVDEQVQAFRERFGSLSLRRARRAHLTAYDVVTIASMVEREAQVARERPLIAAVIWNRLRSSIPLGIDATLRFALHNWTRPLRQSELRNPTPFNTRLHRGLPPTPIGSPGLASLRAAANPAHVGYLYYVVRPGTCGRHAFSSTAAKFDRDVARYNAARARSGGRSPTTCKG